MACTARIFAKRTTHQRQTAIPNFTKIRQMQKVSCTRTYCMTDVSAAGPHSCPQSTYIWAAGPHSCPQSTSISAAGPHSCPQSTSISAAGPHSCPQSCPHSCPQSTSIPKFMALRQTIQWLTRRHTPKGVVYTAGTLNHCEERLTPCA
jgi:hypothetical protein